MAFCYVPSQQQMQQYFNKKTKTKKQSSTVVTSPVDRKISFFGLQGTCAETQISYADKTSADSVWRHLQQDKLWQTVLEYYYSLCNVSHEKRCQAMNVYIRRRTKHKSERKESKKYLSYAEIAHKLGILSIKTQTEVSKQDCGSSEAFKRCDADGALCSTTVASTDRCSSATGCNSTEQLNSNGFSNNVSCSTLASNSHDSVSNVSDQTDTKKLAYNANNCQLSENSSQKSPSDKSAASVGNVFDESRTACTLKGAKYTNVLIDTDKELMDRLSSSPSSIWSISDDLVLVHFLCDICEKSSQGRSKVSMYVMSDQCLQALQPSVTFIYMYNFFSVLTGLVQC